MIATSFEVMTRILTSLPTRRDIMRGIAGAGLGKGCAWLPAFVEAKKKRKHKKKCAKAGQASKKKKRCCRGLVKDTAGRCVRPCTPTSCTATSLCVDRVCQPCDVCQPAGACAFDSVQAAVDDATPGATLTLCAGVFTEIIAIAKHLTLVGVGDGTGPGNTILDGAGVGTVVFIAEGSTVTLQNLRITGGNVTGDGGGIFNRGTLEVTGCTVSGNSANFGGGIDNLGTLTLTDCAVSGNSASGGSGGIGNVGMLALTRCTVSGNTANNGGGIFNFATMELINSTVSGNTADNGGGGIVNFDGTIELINSSVTANAAGSTIGGIWNDEGTVSCSGGSTVSGNTAGDPPVPSDCIDVGGGTGCATCTD